MFALHFRKLMHMKINCLSPKNISIICGKLNLSLNLSRTHSIERANQIISDGSDRFDGTFRRAIWPFLVIGQFFGIMPLIGVSGWSLSDLHFKWKSIRTVYAVCVASILSCYSIFLLWKVFTTRVYLNSIGEKWFLSLNYSSLNLLMAKFCIFSKRFILRHEWPCVRQFSDFSQALARADAHLANS